MSGIVYTQEEPPQVKEERKPPKTLEKAESNDPKPEFISTRPELDTDFIDACLRGPWSLLERFLESSLINSKTITPQEINTIPRDQIIHKHTPVIIEFCSQVFDWDEETDYSPQTCIKDFFNYKSPFTAELDNSTALSKLNEIISPRAKEERMQYKQRLNEQLQMRRQNPGVELSPDFKSLSSVEIDKEIREMTAKLKLEVSQQKLHRLSQAGPGLSQVAIAEEVRNLVLLEEIINEQRYEARESLREPLQVSVQPLNNSNMWTIRIHNITTHETLIMPWHDNTVVPQEYSSLRVLTQEICESLGIQAKILPTFSSYSQRDREPPDNPWFPARIKFTFLRRAIEGDLGPIALDSRDLDSNPEKGVRLALTELEQALSEMVLRQPVIISPDFSLSLQGLSGTGKSTLRRILDLLGEHLGLPIRSEDGDIFIADQIGNKKKLAEIPPDYLTLRTIRGNLPTQLPPAMQLKLIMPILNRAQEERTGDRIIVTDSGGPPPYNPTLKEQRSPLGLGIQEITQAIAHDLTLYLFDLRIPHSELVRTALEQIQISDKDFASPEISGPLYDLLKYDEDVSWEEGDFLEILQFGSIYHREFIIETLQEIGKNERFDFSNIDPGTDYKTIVEYIKEGLPPDIDFQKLINTTDLRTVIHEVRKDLYQPSREKVISLCSENTPLGAKCREILLNGVDTLFQRTGRSIPESSQTLLDAALKPDAYWRGFRKALQEANPEETRYYQETLKLILPCFLRSQYNPQARHETTFHPYKEQLKAVREQERLVSLAMLADPASIYTLPLYRIPELFPPGYNQLVKKCGMNPPLNEFYFNNLMYVILLQMRKGLEEKTQKLERTIHSLASLERIPPELKKSFTKIITHLKQISFRLDKRPGSLYYKLTQALDQLDEQQIKYSVIRNLGYLVKGRRAKDTRDYWSSKVALPSTMVSAEKIIRANNY
jgi:hypothetical protein